MPAKNWCENRCLLTGKIESNNPVNKSQEFTLFFLLIIREWTCFTSRWYPSTAYCFLPQDRNQTEHDCSPTSLVPTPQWIRTDSNKQDQGPVPWHDFYHQINRETWISVPDNNQMETSQSTEAPEEPVVTSQIQTRRLVKTSTAETLMRVHYSNICCIMWWWSKHTTYLKS
jgi:hypothetical protein